MRVKKRSLELQGMVSRGQGEGRGASSVAKNSGTRTRFPFRHGGSGV
jgi:hypothetical protein